ncbi:MAG: ATP-dependent DNA ligase [Candidatus Acidiferrales bacterium]
MRGFVNAADAVAATTKKLEKVRILSEYFRSAPLDDAARAAIFFTGKPFAGRDEGVLGVGGSSLAKLVAEASEDPAPDWRAAYRKHGDWGNVAGDILSTRAGEKKRGVSLAEVAKAFEDLPELRTQTQKSDRLRKLFDKASAGEVKYIIKIITGDLRIGLKESLVEESIAKAFEQPAEAVRRANMMTGDVGETLKMAAQDTLGSARLRLFHPIGFMLATAVQTAEEIFGGEIKTMQVEDKYDGIRAQAHKGVAGVKMFSRTLDPITEFPELEKPIATLPGELILDGEILAWHGARPLPFTELQQRLGRKQMDLWLQHDIPVKFVAFDLLYQDGELLLDTPLAERRRRLEGIFSSLTASSTETAIRIALVTLCDSASSIEKSFRETLAAGHEGVVVKTPESLYTSGRRGGAWFKLKEAYATLDVVVTAVEYGHGRRHSVLSDYTFAIRDGERLLNIGKAYSGLTDAEIREYTAIFTGITIQDQGFRRSVQAKVVIEVAFNNIQKSARHESGFALRFPRILRFRPDKPVTEIDTLESVRQLYEKQITLPRNSGQVGGKKSKG